MEDHNNGIFLFSHDDTKGGQTSFTQIGFEVEIPIFARPNTVKFQEDTYWITNVVHLHRSFVIYEKLISKIINLLDMCIFRR